MFLMVWVWVAVFAGVDRVFVAIGCRGSGVSQPVVEGFLAVLKRMLILRRCLEPPMMVGGSRSEGWG